MCDASQKYVCIDDIRKILTFAPKLGTKTIKRLALITFHQLIRSNTQLLCDMNYTGWLHVPLFRVSFRKLVAILNITFFLLFKLIDKFEKKWIHIFKLSRNLDTLFCKFTIRPTVSLQFKNPVNYSVKIRFCINSFIAKHFINNTKFCDGYLWNNGKLKKKTFVCRYRHAP